MSSPTAFRRLRTRPGVNAILLEHDPRFGTLGNFHFYDFNTPLALPEELLRCASFVLVDPPFLSGKLEIDLYAVESSSDLGHFRGVFR